MMLIDLHKQKNNLTGHWVLFYIPIDTGNSGIYNYNMGIMRRI